MEEANDKIHWPCARTCVAHRCSHAHSSAVDSAPRHGVSSVICICTSSCCSILVRGIFSPISQCEAAKQEKIARRFFICKRGNCRGIQTDIRRCSDSYNPCSRRSRDTRLWLTVAGNVLLWRDVPLRCDLHCIFRAHLSALVCNRCGYVVLSRAKTVAYLCSSQRSGAVLCWILLPRDIRKLLPEVLNSSSDSNIHSVRSSRVQPEQSSKAVPRLGCVRHDSVLETL